MTALTVLSGLRGALYCLVINLLLLLTSKIIDSNMQAIGKKIKRLRELKDLTQDYVASEIGLSQSAYSKIEAGETDLTYQRLEKIAEVLQIKPEDIITFNEQMIFNLQHNQHAQGFVMHNHVNAAERELYEVTIAFLKEEIALLKEIVAKGFK